MGIKKRKTQYLSYIEETPKQIGKIQNAASSATIKARKKALKNGNYVTYLKGKKILKEYPDGRIETVKVIQDSGVSIVKDGELRIHKR